MPTAHRHLPSTQALLCFEAVAHSGSVTRASEQLNMTQSAVSRQINNLEELLGVALFERSRQRLWLNPAGASYLESVCGILEELRSATQRTRRAASGQLCIGIEPALASAWLVPQLKHFYRSHPHVNVELMTDMDKLRSGKARWDLAVVYGEPAPGDGQCIALLQELLVAVASADLLAEGPPINDFADVLNYPIVHHTGPFSTSDSWLGHAGLVPRAIREVPGPRMETFSLVQQCAEQGLGMAFLPTYFVAEALASARLQQAGTLRLATEQRYYLTVPCTRHNPTVALFSDWLQSLAAPHAHHQESP
ncbi:LysR family transcriptional regulator [Parahaliea mediterranea]|uniref:LysR family transcriptional regulator n=1 Tax=Parahaliea mediterranea TaxID=651086 RepID=UPI0013001A1E|nr:LysR substrate-binding domain-containing protein [Parahaliea mediterranea]